MGCFSSKDAEVIGRLDEVEKKIKQVAPPVEGSKDGLEELASLSKELSEIMDKFIDAGAKDTSGIARVEAASDVILGNLTGRVTMKSLQDSSVSVSGADTFKSLEDELLRIARQLDKVRATKASSILEQHIQTEKGKIDTAVEKQASGPMKNIEAAMKKVLSKDPAQLLPGFQAVLDWSEKAHKIATDNKKVTDQLLQYIVQLSIQVLKVEKMWAVNPKPCELIKQLADRLDKIAAELVEVMGAAWDPPMAPQVDAVIKTYADKACSKCLGDANKSLEAGDPGGAYDDLETLSSWWPCLKEAGAHNLEIVGIFSKIQSFANQSIQKASTSGDKATIDGIREFADKFDTLRTKFDGLPPPAERGTLGETLKVGEAKGIVTKNLATLDAEVAKTQDDDKKTTLSLAVVIQAMEVLADRWPSIAESLTASEDEEMTKRVETSCKALEEWADKRASTLPAASCSNLLKFADEYDSRRVKIPPSTALLRPRIALHTARSFLKVAEVEIAKAERMKSDVLLDALKSAAAAIPLDAEGLTEGAVPEVQERLSKVIGTVDSRIMKTWQENLTSSKGANVRKENMLAKFAAELDELRAEHLKEGPVSESLVERLKNRRRTIVEEMLTIVEEQCGKSSATDFEAVVKAFSGVERSWNDSLGDTGKLEELFAEETLQTRVSKAIAGLEPCLSSASTKAAESGDVARIDKLLELATALEVEANSLRVKMGDDEEGVNLRNTVVTLALDAHIKLADSACKEGKPDVLKEELDAMAYLCDNKTGTAPCPDAACESVLEFLSGLRDPLLAMLVGDGDKVKAVQKAASAADEAAKVARRGADAGDKESLVAVVNSVQGALSKLEQARAETAKSSMNPKVVLQVLIDLEPLWPSAASFEVCQKKLMEVLEKMGEKFKDAGRKAMSDEQRLQGLMDFAGKADKAQEALLNQSEGLSAEKNCAIIGRLVADNSLKDMEAELDKDKGMNPAQLIKGVKALATVWSLFGGASAMDPAFDEVAGLRNRWSEVRAKISTRMMESMEEAVSSDNQKKKEALMKFAGEFDTESAVLSEGSVGLEAELRGKMES